MGFSRYFEEGWYNKLKHYVESTEFKLIGSNIAQERKKYIILPPQGSELFLKVFRITSYDEVKVVILGQDLYHGDGQFDGLAFSNSTLDSPQPSLANILEEVENDIYDGFNLERISNFSLYNWAEQGVFLVNAAHTVIKGRPASHMRFWKGFTKEVVKALNDKENLVWLLWGRFAQDYAKYITNDNHKIIMASHPSPLGHLKDAPIPFSGSKCFSKCNEYLKDKGLKEIKW